MNSKHPFRPALPRWTLLLMAAATLSHANYTGTQTGLIGMIQVGQNGSFTITFANNAPMCAGGGNTLVGSVNVGGTVEGVTITQDGARAMLATVTAAKLAGKPVKVYAINGVTGVTWGCQVGAVELPNSTP